MGTSAEPRVAVSPPRLPDRYRPLRPIAAGGTAVVWCAEDELLGRRVAVKLLAEPYASDPDAVRRFQREARAAAQLSGHPHVVTIFDVGETLDTGSLADRRPFIVMEHLAGGTVADALRLREYTLDDAVRWLHEAAGALDFAHRRGILHRDVKLANLLLDGRRTLHVADFGIAQIGGEDTMAGSRQVLGTASYLAPERILGRPATVASDLYSLAVAWFELLSGERPFAASAYLAQAKQHLEADPPPASERNPELSPAVDAVLVRGMAKAPEDRWSSAEAFATAVERALAPASATATAATAVAALADAPSRRAAIARGRRAVAARRGPARTPAPARVPAPTPAPAPLPLAAARPTSVHPRITTLTTRRRPIGRVPPLAGGALTALGLAAGLAVAATGVLGSGHPAPTRPLAAVHSAPRTAPVRATARPAHAAAAHRPTAPAHHPAPHPATTPAPAVSTTQTARTPAPPQPTDALALETRGHALLEGGSAAAAVPVLRQAVSSAQPGSTTYAYALFDLGSALRQAGDTRDAVRVLYSRLQIPNQTDKVRAELTLALQALGRRTASAGAPQGAADRPSSAATPPPTGPTADTGSGSTQGNGD